MLVLKNSINMYTILYKKALKLIRKGLFLICVKRPFAKALLKNRKNEILTFFFNRLLLDALAGSSS